MHGTDALPLPPHPDAHQYRKLSKDLLLAARSEDPDAVRAWAERWLTRLQALTSGAVGGDGGVARHARRIAGYWSDEAVRETPAPRRTLAGTQHFLARAHGFRNWAEMVRHLAALRDGESGAARFEAAVDAVVAGDIGTLRRLLQQSPELVRARSDRAHRATLLHYVSANGVEGFRQKTPPNIVDIAKTLLDAGADIGAEAHCYGGGDTTLGLTATSVHPENAGVMRALLDCLLQADADLGHRDGGWGPVRAALANGRGDSALWLAEHGAPLDLEEAAGVGRLDLVRRLVADDGTPLPPSTGDQLVRGFNWACEFGRTHVVRWLLDRAADRLLANPHQIGLHWAAHGGWTDIVELLLQHGWPANAVEETHRGTPLSWALHGWGNARIRRPGYYETVARLVRAGAAPDPAWYDADRDPAHGGLQARLDQRMLAALRGELSA